MACFEVLCGFGRRMLMLRAVLRIRIFSLFLSRISWLVLISCFCCIGRVLEEVIVKVFGYVSLICYCVL